MISLFPLKCIRVGGSQGCFGCFAYLGSWVCFLGLCLGPLYTTCIFRGALRC
jgi:hypothetical protein